MLLPSALLGLFGVGTFYFSSPFVALASLSVALFGVFSWAGNLQTVITEITPRQNVAVLYGITGACGTLAGGVTQLFIGRTVDRIGYEPVFILAGVGLLLAMVLVMSAGKIELFQPALIDESRAGAIKKAVF